MKGLGILAAAMALTYGTSLVMQKPGMDGFPRVGMAMGSEAELPVVNTSRVIIHHTHAMRCSERLGRDTIRTSVRAEREANPCASF